MKIKLLDEVLKYLPILGVILIIAGNIKLLVYYKTFNFEVFPFIGLDEILILFIQNSLAYLLLLIAWVLSLTIFRLNDGDDLPPTIGKRLLKYLLNKRLFLLLAILSISSLVYHLYRPNPNRLELGYLIGAFFFVTYLVPITIQEAYLKLKLKSSALPIIFLVIIFLSVTTFSIVSALNESSKVKSGYYKKIEVVFEDFIYKSNINCYYIGQTHNYIFFYNSRTNSVTSYPMSKVKLIRF
jgi:hypothetical protein